MADFLNKDNADLDYFLDILSDISSNKNFSGALSRKVSIPFTRLEDARISYIAKMYDVNFTTIVNILISNSLNEIEKKLNISESDITKYYNEKYNLSIEDNNYLFSAKEFIDFRKYMDLSQKYSKPFSDDGSEEIKELIELEKKFKLNGNNDR